MSTSTRLAFGSCSNSGFPQPLWAPIASLMPDAFIWAGDVVYNDNTCGFACFRSSTPAEMAENYDRQRAQPGYAALRAKVPIMGTWDVRRRNRNLR